MDGDISNSSFILRCVLAILDLLCFHIKLKLSFQISVEEMMLEFCWWCLFCFDVFRFIWLSLSILLISSKNQPFILLILCVCFIDFSLNLIISCHLLLGVISSRTFVKLLRGYFPFFLGRHLVLWTCLRIALHVSPKFGCVGLPFALSSEKGSFSSLTRCSFSSELFSFWEFVSFLMFPLLVML